jgi:hypothetical protein
MDAGESVANVLSVISDSGAWAFTVTFAIYILKLIYSGKLVPGKTVAILLQTIEAERAANAELRAALTEYQAQGLTAAKFFESIQGERKEANKP